MSSRELSEWIAYERIHPLPDPHYSAALISSTVANAMGADTTADDFLPTLISDEPQTPDEGLRRFDAFGQAHNSRLIIHG